MNNESRRPPRYWIGHSTFSDNVIMATARRTRKECIIEMRHIYGKDCFEVDSSLTVSLIELKLVEDKS